MIHRRSLLVGIGSLLFAPAIVKADSLMALRGLSMDPLVLMFDGDGLRKVSAYHYNNLHVPVRHLQVIMGNSGGMNYGIQRLSEAQGFNWGRGAL